MTLRATYESGAEIEFNIAPLTWASTDPVDPGTYQVIKNGARILWDSKELLDRLINKTG